jgi:hypothetical protein
MKVQRVVRCGLAVSVILALVVMGVSGPGFAQDKTTGASPGTEPAAQRAPAPKLPVPLAVQATSATLSVAGTSLRPRTSSTTYGFSNGGSTYALAGTDFFNAPVYLPQGAVITSFRMYYFDANATVDCSGFLTYYQLGGPGAVELGPITSTGSSGFGFVDSGPINLTVDNTLYTYVLNWRPNVTGAGMTLNGFSIFYTPPVTPTRSAVIPLY